MMAVAVLGAANGCVTSGGASKLAKVIEALGHNTNECYLKVTSPAFGTLEYSRNSRGQHVGDVTAIQGGGGALIQITPDGRVWTQQAPK